MSGDEQDLLKDYACCAQDSQLGEERDRTRKLMMNFNSSTQDETENRRKIIEDVFREVGEDVWLEPPFYCQYGGNTTLGNMVYFNVCCILVDECPVTIGDHVLFGPAVKIGSSAMPLRSATIPSEKKFKEKSIEVGSDVWVGGGATICPGVKIGNGSVIGAGSVVTQDVPANVIAVGNPCRVIKELTQLEKVPTFPPTTLTSEKEKMLSGQMYYPGDPQLCDEEHRTRSLMKEFNDSSAGEKEKRLAIIKQLLGAVGENTRIEPPFYCDYGANTTLGNNVFINSNCVILDVCPVTIGDNVILGPAVQVYPATHPLSATERRTGLEFGKSVKIGSDVWIGGSAIICPGVAIGAGAVIGAGSVVTKDIPANVLAVGNPCRVIEELT